MKKIEPYSSRKDFRYDGHAYYDIDGNIFDSTDKLIGSVSLDPAKEYWVIHTQGIGQLIHVNEEDSYDVAVRCLVNCLQH